MNFKVLIADDDYINRRLLLSLLKKELYQVEVLEAVDGESALVLSQENKDIELIIADVEMPMMDGSAFIKKYRYENPNSHVPILAISSNDLRAKEVLYMGANKFLTKPITGDKLLDAIMNVQN